MNMVPHDFKDLLDLLGRGGAYQYWFTLPDQRTTWYPVGAAAALPGAGVNVYYGVCPTEARTTKRPKAADVVAVNALWAD